MKFIFGCLLVVAAVSATAVSAAEGSGITVTPMLQEVDLEAGETSETFLASIKNDTGAPITLELSVVDFGSLDESGGVAFLGATGDLEQKYALASWMQPEVSEVTLDPGQERQVRVRVENRESLSPGGHYGALVFESVSAPKSGAPNVAINQLFASLVFVKKVGGALYGLELTSLEHASHWYRISPSLRMRFRNTGNVHVTPRGEIRVTDPLGRLTHRAVLNEGSSIILPETFREYPAKLFSVSRAFIPGNYTLSLSYRYDGRDDADSVTQSIFFVPPIGSAVFAGGIGLGGVIIWIRRRRSRDTAA